MEKNTAAKFIAKRIAGDLEYGSVVNLGIGLPTSVSDYISDDMEVVMHAENGVVGMGSGTSLDEIYNNASNRGYAVSEVTALLINAGSTKAGILRGASFFDSSASFGLIRGGHVDVTVLGTMEVDQEGNIANWMIPGQKLNGMGGAMDLCVGAKKVFIATYHQTKGKPKLLKKCRLPLTARGVVTTIYTEMGVFDVNSEGLRVREYNPQFTLSEIRDATEAELIIDDHVKKTPDYYFENL
ncbi:3-oxoacid CoA-transferase subunit B [Proteiniclasticum sp. C24MP]|uniref:3-oxoacid CoA-transferase subunit B n=1 Tax=Proteiniclasticum sp. C24MP TaxID=3374101 RepID=UPI003754B6AD